MTKEEQAAFLKSMGVSTAAIYNFLHNGGGLSIATTGKRVGVDPDGQRGAPRMGRTCAWDNLTKEQQEKIAL